jgi:hypothetical protein
VTRPQRVLRIVAVAAVALLLAACGSYSEKPADYLPTTVGDKAVQANDDFAESIVSSLKGPDATDVVAGTIGGGGEGPAALPDTVLVAARTTTRIDSKSSVEQIIGVREDIAIDTQRIGGVPVDIAEVQGEFAPRDATEGIAVALAAPQPNVQLIVVVFRGGKNAAQQGVGAMLEAGRR